MKNALCTEVSTGGGRVLINKKMGHGDILHVDVGLDGIGVGLGRASQILEDVHYASIHGGLEERTQHQHRIHNHKVNSSLLGSFPCRLLRHRLSITIPVLSRDGEESASTISKHYKQMNESRVKKKDLKNLCEVKKLSLVPSERGNLVSDVMETKVQCKK